jgi:hypothetical protein
MPLGQILAGAAAPHLMSSKFRQTLPDLAAAQGLFTTRRGANHVWTRCSLARDIVSFGDAVNTNGLIVWIRLTLSLLRRPPPRAVSAPQVAKGRVRKPGTAAPLRSGVDKRVV